MSYLNHNVTHSKDIITSGQKDAAEQIFNLCANTITNIFVWKFGDADETQVQMAKHILKTVCTDVTNILFNFLAADMMMSVENPSTISSEVRQGDANATTKSDSLWVFEIHWWTY